MGYDSHRVHRKYIHDWENHDSGSGDHDFRSFLGFPRFLDYRGGNRIRFLFICINCCVHEQILLKRFIRCQRFNRYLTFWSYIIRADAWYWFSAWLRKIIGSIFEEDGRLLQATSGSGAEWPSSGGREEENADASEWRLSLPCRIWSNLWLAF